MLPSSASMPASALRLAVDVRRLPWMRRLALDYAFDFPRLRAFYAGDPAEPAAWADAIDRTGRHPRQRDVLARVVGGQLERRDAPAEARAAAARLADARSVAIVTGQQAGLFGGPLFTVLKAITAIRLADRVAREHGVPAVPVFWIDAEDHDWDEIATCGVLDADQALRVIRTAPPEGAGHRPVAALRYADDIGHSVDALRAVLPPTEFTDALLAALAESYRPGRSVVEAFARWLDRALGARGLIVYDAADPAAKPLAASVFRQELEHPGRTASLAAASGAALVEAGYHMQVTPHDDTAALFDLSQGRRSIRVAGTGYVVGDDDGVVPQGELAERAGARPELFSPNVLLRPIVQDTTFPTVCYVAGPNELAYLGQLRPVYEAFGLPMPLMQPRATTTVADTAALRFLTRYRVPFESLQAQDEAALNELLRTLLPPSVERTLLEAKAAIAERMAAVIAAVPVIDPTLEGAARSTLGKVEHDLKGLHGKILQAAKRRDETLRRQFTHVQALTFPGGEPQERSVGFVSFLNRYGPALIDRLVEELPVDARTHWVVTV